MLDRDDAPAASLERDFDAGIVTITDHRPWPMRERPWLMTQSWNDLLFAHWRTDPATLRKKVPAEFELDLFDGEAWIGVVPFYMTNVALRRTPALPWVSEFAEINVRTYVRVGHRPGVYFFSLDAARWLAVRIGRPYRVEIHHPPWRLHAAEAEISLNSMAAASGLVLANHRPVLHFARRQDMVAWPPEFL